MLVLDAQETAAALAWSPLIAALDEMFKSGCEMPVRHHHAVEMPAGQPATLLLMPAWVPGRYVGVKLVSVYPDNHLQGLPAIHGAYLLTSGASGEMLALIEGGALTARRTAAASALAATHLARADAQSLLVVGTGRLSLNLIEAHAAVRPIREVAVWGRSPAKAAAVVAEANALGFEARVADDLKEAARAADIISCATLSNEPLIHGAWLKPGTHLDLIGAFKPTMRECDDAAVARARVYVDTREGALAEAGDILQAIAAGAFAAADIAGDLRELVTGARAGRTSDAEITLFKSVGAASEDLAAAILAYETCSASR